ncbi:MAG: Rieske (2Fe-2S) protein [Sporichthyaceae bacterium]
MTVPTDIPTCADGGAPCAARRAVLRGAAAIGAVGLLAACGGGDSKDVAAPPAGGTNTGGTNTGGTNTGGTDPGPGTTTGGGTDLGPATGVPVGGGTIFDDQKIVVTQPVAGEYKAFSAVCTHTGCIVTSVEDKVINCACHGSMFSIEDGSVKGGLAKAPLPAKTVKVEGGNLKVT